MPTYSRHQFTKFDNSQTSDYLVCKRVLFTISISFTCYQIHIHKEMINFHECIYAITCYRLDIDYCNPKHTQQQFIVAKSIDEVKMMDCFCNQGIHYSKRGN